MDSNKPKSRPESMADDFLKPADDAAFESPEVVASATECTGLSPAAVLDEQEAGAYAQLYSVHRQKPVTYDKPE